MENTPTLRDQFAMAALTGMLANQDMTSAINDVVKSGKYKLRAEVASTYAFAVADVMMLERDKKKD
jgi:hypothetical protein